jgi:hypothetical protein
MSNVFHQSLAYVALNCDNLDCIWLKLQAVGGPPPKKEKKTEKNKIKI